MLPGGSRWSRCSRKRLFALILLSHPTQNIPQVSVSTHSGQSIGWIYPLLAAIQCVYLKLSVCSVLSPRDRITSLEPLSPNYLRKSLFPFCTLCCWKAPQEDLCWECLHTTYHPVLLDSVCVKQGNMSFMCHRKGSPVKWKVPQGRLPMEIMPVLQDCVWFKVKNTKMNRSSEGINT